MNEKLTTLTLTELQSAITGDAAAFRAVTEYQPAGGPGSKIFPATYEGGKYATEGPKPPRRGADGSEVVLDYERVLLDSVQSQANRMELALLQAWEDQELALPVITVDFTGFELPKVLRVTSLEAPHRIADALLRDSIYEKEKVKFRESSIGKALDSVDGKNATPLFEFCPTALLFGLWDSTGPKGGGGAKFARAMVSEIVGHDVEIGVKTSSRIDPAQILLAAGPIYAGKTGGWTLDESKARTEKNRALKIGKDGKPSEVNHGNVTPTIEAGGVTIAKALQTVVLSLTALRRLRFPLNGEKSRPGADSAARVTLAALGLCAATLAREQNQDLRSRCQLFPAASLVWELLDEPGEAPKRFSLDKKGALALFSAALEKATSSGLPWCKKEVVLKPSAELVELVRRSQVLAAQDTLDNGDK